MVRESHELQLDLERGRAEQPRDLGFGGDLVGHEIEQRDAQWSDILPRGFGFPHHDNTLGLQRAASGKIVGYADRHVS